MSALDCFAEQYLSPMVGRHDELRVLKQALQDVRDHHRAEVVFITGETGVGKSRLGMEFCRQVVGEARILVSGQVLSHQPTPAYWVFLELIRNSLGVQADTPTAEVRRRLAETSNALLGKQASEILPYLEYLLSLPPADAKTARQVEFLDPERLRQRIFLSVRSFLEALASRQPLILVLEDLLEADEPSLDLFESLLEWLAETPVLILAISRPFLQGKLSQVLQFALHRLKEACHQLDLPTLEQTDIRVFLDQVLGGNELPSPTGNLIVEYSKGLPLYIEEVVCMLSEIGALQKTSAGWKPTEVASLQQFDFPKTIQGLIRWRFEHLDPAQSKLLQAASVVGKRFHVSILQSVLQSISPQQLEQQLERLCERGFLVKPFSPVKEWWEFRHNLTAESIYATLTQAERAYYHGCVGQALESFYAAQLNTQVDLLAYHYGLSDQTASALRFALLAGQRAARRYHNDQAQVYFQRALDWLPQTSHEPIQAVEAYMGLGDVLLLIGEYQPARQHYQSALQILSEEPRSRFLGQICTLTRKIGVTYERQGYFDQALEYLRHARELVKDSTRPFPGEEAQVLNDLGWIHFRLGNLVEAENALIHALSLAQQAQRYDITASIYNRLGGVYWQKDDLEKATNFVRKSIALRQELGDMAGVARSYNNLGLLEWKRGNWDSALENFNRSLAMHTVLGDIEGLIDVHGNIGLLQLDRGSIVEARTHLEESLAKAHQIGHHYIIAMTLMYLSRYHLALEAWGMALHYAQQSHQALEGLGAQDEWLDIFTLYGQAYLGMGDLDQAAYWATKIYASLPRTPAGDLNLRSNEVGRALRLLGEVERCQKNFTQAEQWLTMSAQVFSRLGNSLEQARTMIAQANLAAERDDQTAARVLLNEARIILRALGANLDLQRLEATNLERYAL